MAINSSDEFENEEFTELLKNGDGTPIFDNPDSDDWAELVEEISAHSDKDGNLHLQEVKISSCPFTIVRTKRKKC